MSGDATPVAARRLPGRAARQGGDARPRSSGLVAAMLDHAAPVRAATPAIGADGRHLRHRRRPVAHRQHLDDGAPSSSRPRAHRSSSTATGRRAPRPAPPTCSRRSASRSTSPRPRSATASREAGIVFCFAPVFHPGMRHAARRPPRARRRAPCSTCSARWRTRRGPAAQVVGLRRPAAGPGDGAGAARPRHPRARRPRRGRPRRAVDPRARRRVWDATGTAVVESVVDAVDLGIAALRAGGAARPGRGVQRGRGARGAVAASGPTALDPVRDAVLLGAAAALVAHDAALARRTVRRPRWATGSPPRCRARPRRSTTGLAAPLLDRWIAVSPRLAGR